MIPAMVASTLGWFVLRSAAGVPDDLVRTETFTVLAICQWFNVLNCRSERRSAFNLSVLRNPWLVGGLAARNFLQVLVVFWAPLGPVFHTVPLVRRRDGPIAGIAGATGTTAAPRHVEKRVSL